MATQHIIKILGLLLLLCKVELGASQLVVLQGGIVDSATKKPLADCQVVLKDSNDVIIQFVRSNENGRYEITVENSPEIVKGALAVSLVGYLGKEKAITPGKNNYDFELAKGNDQLPEVIVRGLKPVTQTGDTISYNVEYFSDSSDRSIGDVMKRIPGIAVDESGRISYNGKPISNLYIQGDDLMSGRYGAATKAIRKEQIKSIDVLLNYQPINVLRDKVFTDKTAINLTLKDPKRLKLSGLGMAGAGTPEQYDAEASTILLNEKIKMLNAAKANNSGIDYSNEIKNYNRNQLYEAQDFAENRELLNSALASTPDIPLNYYYRNNSQLVNLNNLYSTKDSLQIKVNFNWHGDKNDFPFSSQQFNILPNGDTTLFDQQQQASTRMRNTQAMLSLQANKQRAYWHNKTNLQWINQSEQSNLSFNEDQFSQSLSTKHQRISNDFMFIPATKGNTLIEMKWVGNYQKMPQLLQVHDGVAPDVVNNGKDYQALRQSLTLPSYFSNASIALIGIRPSKFTQSFEVRHLAEHRQLQSQMDLLQDDNMYLPYVGDTGNAVDWRRQFLQAKAQMNFRSDKWQIVAGIPLKYQTIHFNQRGFDEPPSSKRLLFNPDLYLRYNVNLQDRITMRASLTNNFGNIEQVYQGLVATNFRSFNRNAPVVQETDQASVTLSYDLQRAIKLLSANVQVQFDRITSNTLQASVFDSNSQQQVLLPVDNNQNAFTASGQISYYFTPLRTKATFNALWRSAFDNQFINGSAIAFRNNLLSMGTELYGNLFQKITYRYNGGFITSRSSQRNAEAVTTPISNRYERMEHNLVLGFVFKRGLITSGIRHTSFRNASLDAVKFTATDIGCRYQLKKLRTDLSFDVTNLLNAREYQVFAVSSNQFSVANYPLRTRMAILRATFSL